MFITEKIDNFNNLLNDYIKDLPTLYKTVDFFQNSLDGNLSLDGIKFYLKKIKLIEFILIFVIHGQEENIIKRGLHIQDSLKNIKNF